MKSSLSKLTLGLCLTSLGFTSFAATTLNQGLKTSTTKVIFGYYANWDTYGRNFQPQDIPYSSLTTVIYAFAQVGNCAPPYPTDANPTCNQGSYATGVNDNALYSTDPYSDFAIVPKEYKLPGSAGLGNMNKVINLAHKNKVAAVLSIGGYTLSYNLTQVMLNENTRQNLIASIISFLNSIRQSNNGQGFDGIDIDWEPHMAQWSQVSAAEISGFTTFIQELRQALRINYSPLSTLTIAAPASPNAINMIGAQNWNIISNNIDFLNVMTYDYHGGFDSYQITDFQAPLYYDPNQPAEIANAKIFNIDSTIQAYLAMGLPAKKLILGIPAYGRAVSGVNNQSPPNEPNSPGLYQSFSGTPSGEWNDGTGMYDYKYIEKSLVGAGGFIEYNNSIAIAAAAYNPQSQIWISYDNTASVTAKAQYTVKNGLGGMMMWELSGDISPNDKEYQRFSLLNAMQNNLESSR